VNNDTIEQTYANAKLAAHIVMAYVSNNALPAKDFPALIGEVHAAVASLGGPVTPTAAAEPEIEKPTAAQIKKSITPDALISFIDGKPYSLLKRHLTKHGLDAKSYRERYGLPSDYPMTAPRYSERRSALAKDLGLGRFGGRARKQAAE